MPPRLHRYYGSGYSHFITASCYRRLPLLGSVCSRDLFLQALEQTRRCYRFVVVGYVVMPEHVHLLLTEPERGDPSIVMHALKQSFAQRLLRRFRSGEDLQQGSVLSGSLSTGNIWQKRVEKLRYMHRNPVKRGLVFEPQQWEWSSLRHYAYGEAGKVLVNEPRKGELEIRKIG